MEDNGQSPHRTTSVVVDGIVWRRSRRIACEKGGEFPCRDVWTTDDKRGRVFSTCSHGRAPFYIVGRSSDFRGSGYQTLAAAMSAATADYHKLMDEISHNTSALEAAGGRR